MHNASMMRSRLIVLALLASALTACGGSQSSSTSATGATPAAANTQPASTAPPGPAPSSQAAPLIAHFTASTPAVTEPQLVTLSWAVANASSLSVAPGVGSVAGTAITVRPLQTTTYTLSASGVGGQSSATTTVTVGSVIKQFGTLAAADLGHGANLNGALPFPIDNPWNLDISQAPVDPNSDALIQAIGLSVGLHPDFGAGLYQGAPIGIPFVIVPASQAPVAVAFQQYGDESDPGPYPLPPGAPIEGQLPTPQIFGGDRHVLVVNRGTNRLYEMDNSAPQSGGTWFADAGAIFHLDSDVVRPTAHPGWTSADAAGLPIFPGLARYEEAGSGSIPHALRFTVAQTRRAYVPPANHYASTSAALNLPPMGMRVRLKASYVIPATFSAPTRTILQALKTYGMFVADNGSNWYISGAPDERWDNDALVSELKQVTGSNFEVVQMNGLVSAN